MLLTYGEPISSPAEYTTKCKAIPATSEDAHSKQCGQEMAGYLYPSDSFVSLSPHELLPSSQKTKLKGKGSFPSVFGLCTEIEICPLSSCSVDRPESLHPCSPKSRVILYILLRPTVNRGPSFHNRIDPSALHRAESSKHPFVMGYPSSKPRRHQCLIFCFSFTNLEIISMYTCLPGTQKQD